MKTVTIPVPPVTMTNLKNAAKKLGVTFPKLIKECLFLALIHLDTSTPGVIRFKGRMGREI